ncbi:hypothetical protein [Mucilaginibacter sp.]
MESISKINASASLQYAGIRLLLCIVFWIAVFQSATAQGFSFSDLFGQANKQKQYYMQQIAAYNAFESELKQGYGIIKHGINGIASINTAELNAHRAYYASLKQPGPQVKNNTQVQDITQWQLTIINQFNSVRQVNGLTSDEQSYVAGVQDGILKNCNSDLTDLQNLMASGTLQMTDDQRLKRLAKINQNMQDKYEFTQSFCNTVRLLGIERQQGASDTQTLKKIYGTN